MIIVSKKRKKRNIYSQIKKRALFFLFEIIISMSLKHTAIADIQANTIKTDDILSIPITVLSFNSVFFECLFN